MLQWRRVGLKVRGVKRTRLTLSKLALVYWLQAKRVLREKREREAREKAKRRRNGS